MEDVRQTLLDTSRSLVHVQTFNSVITLHLAAAQTLCTGRPRAERVFDPQGSVVSEPGEVPVAMKATEAVFDPASVPGLACACVRQVAVPDLYGPNLSAVGKIGCGARGLGANNYKVIRDHNTTPGDPDNGTSGGLVIPQLPDDPECDDESAFPSGMVSRACREHSGDPACDDPFSFFHPGICNSGSMIEVRSGTTPRGSDWIENSTAIGLLADGGACRTDRPRNPNGSCMLRDYGEDCLPCTGDDLRLGTPITLVLTTGTAQAAVYDANNVRPSSPIDAGSGTTCSSDAECRPHERCRRTCEESGLPCAGDGDCAQPGIEDVCRPPRCEVLCGGFTRCLSSRSGEPFDCDLLLAEPEGGQLTGALVFARPDVDGFRIGDNVTTGTLRFE